MPRMPVGAAKAKACELAAALLQETAQDDSKIDFLASIAGYPFTAEDFPTAKNRQIMKDGLLAVADQMAGQANRYGKNAKVPRDD